MLHHRFVHSILHSLRIVPELGSHILANPISAFQGIMKICQLPSITSYDNYWPVQKVGTLF